MTTTVKITPQQDSKVAVAYHNQPALTWIIITDLQKYISLMPKNTKGRL